MLLPIYEVSVGFASELMSFSQLNRIYYVGDMALRYEAYLFCNLWYKEDSDDGYGNLSNRTIFNTMSTCEIIGMMSEKGISNIHHKLGRGWISVECIGWTDSE